MQYMTANIFCLFIQVLFKHTIQTMFIVPLHCCDSIRLRWHPLSIIHRSSRSHQCILCAGFMKHEELASTKMYPTPTTELPHSSTVSNPMKERDGKKNRCFNSCHYNIFRSILICATFLDNSTVPLNSIPLLMSTFLSHHTGRFGIKTKLFFCAPGS